MAPRLTIAIPTVNRAGLVGRAIESALAQTSKDIEIIVSDNGSTDGTQEVIAGYAGRGIRTFRRATTVSAARHGQFLFEQACGEFFVGLSDDDFLETEFAAEVLDMFTQHPELSFVYTGCAVHYEDCQVPALVGPPIEPGTDFVAAHYAGKRELSWCACVSRVRDLRELGPQPDDRVLGDMFFWTKLAFRGPVGCVPRILSHYTLLRGQNDNISHGTSPVEWARECRLLAEEVIAAARRAGADDKYLLQFESDARKQVARSTANQFVWTRIRGASLLQSWKWLFRCARYLDGSFAAMSRVLAALFLPRNALRRELLARATKLAEKRHELDSASADVTPASAV